MAVVVYEFLPRTTRRSHSRLGKIAGKESGFVCLEIVNDVGNSQSRWGRRDEKYCRVSALLVVQLSPVDM